MTTPSLIVGFRGKRFHRDDRHVTPSNATLWTAESSATQSSINEFNTSVRRGRNKISHAVVSDAPPAQQPAVGFLKLPRELRDMVYCYYFEDVYEGSEHVDLVEAIQEGRVPSFDIILVCKQFRGETLQLYWIAASNFWPNHDYAIEIDARRTSKKALRNRDQASSLANVLNNLPVLDRIWFKIRWQGDKPSSWYRAAILDPELHFEGFMNMSFSSEWIPRGPAYWPTLSSEWVPRGPAYWATPNEQRGTFIAQRNNDLMKALCHTPPQVKGQNWFGFDDNGIWLGLDIPACTRLVCEKVDMVMAKNAADVCDDNEIHISQDYANQNNVDQNHDVQYHGAQNHDTQTPSDEDQHSQDQDGQDDVSDLDGMARLTKQFREWYL